MSKDIYNNPSFKKLREQMQGAADLEVILEVLSGNENLLGDHLSELRAQLEEMSSIPGEFNKYFSQLGWVAHESLSLDVMKGAVNLANAGNLSEGERLILDHFSASNLEDRLHWLRHREPFQQRWELIQLAFTDYKEGRYHAAIPVVLMTVDGAVNDVTKSAGLFAEGSDVTAWDSVAGHESGLKALQQIFTKTRKKTTTEEITLPFRNGILHGRDLGYATELIAAKCWAALFTVSDWAEKLNKGDSESEQEETDPDLLESIAELIDAFEQLEKVKLEGKIRDKKISEWQAREMILGRDFDMDSTSKDLSNDTPEYTAALFMEHWGNGNYGGMAKCLEFKSGFEKPFSKLAGELREQFEDFKLESWELIKIGDQAPAITEVSVRISYYNGFQNKMIDLPIRLIIENEEGEIGIWGEEGKWGVMQQNFWMIT